MSSSQDSRSDSAPRKAPLTDYENLTQSADFIRQLDAASRSSNPLNRFPPAHERRYREDAREKFGHARALTSLLPALMLVTSPLWGQPLMNPPQDFIELIRIFEFLLIIPLCLASAWMLWRRPRSVISETLFMVCFLVLAVTLEWLRHRGTSMGFMLSPSLSSCVLVGFIVIGRVPLREGLAFIALYLSFILFSDWMRGPDVPTGRSRVDWLVEIIFIGVVISGAMWNELYSRRNWAAQQLLKSLAYVDALTKLPNRRAFEQHYEAVARHARREYKRLFVALIDMDHFKNLNDRHGHDYGDGVLVEMGLVLSDFARRPLDMASRLGGEEFAVVLYDCSRADGLRRLEELRRQIESLDLANAGTELGRVTISAGGIGVHADVPLAEAYRLADTVLYAAKHQGRNRTVIADSITASGAAA
ncbi:GGDEF domain-containing protein [Solimonas sp. K1W22B-7]|uniref:GGDEF domain-containing protein n=1 Tax=Solimonas sp. K1W22B-7 TaxID=2303331 RepID=UPI0013C49AD9|nr:GGDEF domain-containing protein [Solimonas sp. K1W22B-7]